jgi:GAF domain-containing protein
MDPDPNTGTAPADARLARRDAILAAVARAAARLSEPHPWESLVPDALRILGEATGVSRVYVFEVERVDGKEVVCQRFEWCAEGVAPQIDNPELQNVPLEAAGFTRWAEFLKKGEPVFGDVGDFPESERPLLEMQEIKSLLVQPIFEGTRWWGFMGFDACASVQSWERVEVDTLRIATLVLGSAINRQSRDALLRETQKLEALGRMAGSVSHDFNNVLMVIAGAMELLRGELEDAGQHAIARGQHATMVDQALARSRGGCSTSADAGQARRRCFRRSNSSAGTSRCSSRRSDRRSACGSSMAAMDGRSPPCASTRPNSRRSR